MTFKVAAFQVLKTYTCFSCVNEGYSVDIFAKNNFDTCVT